MALLSGSVSLSFLATRSRIQSHISHIKLAPWFFSVLASHGSILHLSVNPSRRQPYDSFLIERVRAL